MNASWTLVKSIVDTHEVKLQYVENESSYLIRAVNGNQLFECVLYKNNLNDDLVDFETNYKPTANDKIIQSVQGQFEREDIVLKLACIKGTADVNGDLTLSIKVPGTFGTDFRYVAGGYAYVDVFTFGTDKVTKIEVVDDDNVVGYGAGTVLKEYYDSEVSSTNQGWYFYPYHGTTGEIEIEPMGWYGTLPAEVYLKMTFKIGSLKTVFADIWWGKSEP